MNINARPKTIFCDIDGCLILHTGKIEDQPAELTLLKDTLETLSKWDKLGYGIILTTGRRESTRRKTEKQLSKLGIFYDQLIMGIGGGTRVLINDIKPNSDDPTAIAFNIDRNEGIGNINI